jgi:hypothetical protein
MLGEYLRAACAQRWDTGVTDCCTLAGDWALTWGRGDPMAEWRGRYSTDEEAVALIAEAGGLVELWQRGLAAIDVWGVNDPEPGDAGVIVALGMDNQPEHVGAIWTGRRWAFRAPAGVFFASAEVVRAGGPRS